MTRGEKIKELNHLVWVDEISAADAIELAMD